MRYNSIYKPGLFHGQSVVITGGGTGIGRCTAHELASLGARVALVGRRIDRLEATAREIAEDGGTATCHGCDIRDEEQVRAAVADIMKRHGRIDGLINNAGGQFFSPLRDMKTKGWETVIRNNLTGGFIFSREVYLAWMERNGGAIVNIVADIGGGWPNCAHSAAARAGMMSLTESAASEWAPAGVRVNAVAPGFIISSGMETYPEQEQQEHLAWRWTVPMQRFGTEAEVSALILFLLSPAAAYVTGSLFRVDGGAPNARKHHELSRHKNSVPFDGFHRRAQVSYSDSD